MAWSHGRQLAGQILAVFFEGLQGVKEPDQCCIDISDDRQIIDQSLSE